MNKYETKLVPMLDRSDFDLIDKNRYGINYYRLPNKLIVAMDYTDVCESLMCGGFMTYYAMGIGKTKIEALSVKMNCELCFKNTEIRINLNSLQVCPGCYYFSNAYTQRLIIAHHAAPDASFEVKSSWAVKQALEGDTKDE